MGSTRQLLPQADSVKPSRKMNEIKERDDEQWSAEITAFSAARRTLQDQSLTHVFTSFTTAQI
jgi:hypothetical protein